MIHKTYLLAAAVLFAGFASLVASREPLDLSWHVTLLLRTLGAVLVLVAPLLLLARHTRGRTAALLRLDLFLPRLRKAKPHLPARTPSLPWRIARRILPLAWLSDPVGAKPGRIRLFLRWLGPSVQAAPVRRAVQGICFVVFLVLFHYVCWPYSARPSPPARIWTGGSAAEIAQESGDVRVSGLHRDGASLSAGMVVFLYEEKSGSTERALDETLVGKFRVVAVDDDSCTFKPAAELTDAQFDRLLTGSAWQVSDRALDAWPSHYADELARKERVSAELFLAIDPLVSLSTAVASRSWIWSLASAAAILLVCLLVPRGFCGYLCPLGTLIDLFDTLIGRRVTRLRVPDDGWWVHIKYYLLAGIMVCAAGGVLVSGYFAAIPVITRGLLFVVEPFQTGLQRGHHLVPPLNAGHFVSLVLLAVVLGLGFLKPRFWCKYVCPSGAVFSVFNVARVTERKVESTCINCNKCVEICPFDAIKPDFTTRETDCTLCQTCGGVCPTEAIKFVDRWNLVDLKLPNDPPTGETTLGRRGFLSLAAGGAAALAGGVAAVTTTRLWGARLDDPQVPRPVRPPGSVPETQFLQMCIRCGECFKACPNNVLHPLAFQQGLEGLWTPQVVADWAGCESSCNACGQVCPTGAIRALPLEEKRVARMGLAIIDPATCLPLAGREACQLCVDDCHAAGYHAIEFTRVHTQVDADGQPMEGSGFVAPVVLADQCVGCGLCQTRCYGINVADKGLLDRSAIVVLAGEGREDRMMSGSYREIREREARERRATTAPPTRDNYLPDFLQEGASTP